MKIIVLVAIIVTAHACSDFAMNFTNPAFKLSARTMDLGIFFNFTISSWPIGSQFDGNIGDNYKSTIGALGVSANWFGDKHYGFPSIFVDGVNEKGLSCGLQTLVGTQYQERSQFKEHVFAGSFCFWAIKQFATVYEVKAAMEKTVVWGPDGLAQHFIMHDASGAGLILEFVDGKQRAYLDLNDGGASGFGITTNEPGLDWHIENVRHYEWKRTLARQAIEIPGNFYPDDRFLRIHMVKQGMANLTANINSFQRAFSLTAQVMNTITVPMGEQYGTDSGDTSGEGNADHTVFGLIRDHADPTIYWRDSQNPTFRRLRLADVPLVEGSSRLAVKIESGPFFIDMRSKME